MSEHLLNLSDSDLRNLAAALRGRRLTSPFTALGLQRYVLESSGPVLAADLQRLADTGLSGEQLAATIDLLLEDRVRQREADEVIDLVTTGPAASGIAHRDTSVVVRELFAHASESVLVAGYAVHRGQQVFRALADRMRDQPKLRVRLFLNVQRGHTDTTAPGDLVHRFANHFKNDEWPADRPLPEVFYDPRSVEITDTKRASLHAKCVVVDDQRTFISSANFTEAAHERNIEVGLLIRSATLAQQLVRYFDTLLSRQLLRSVF